jgi:hypothetical protein
MMAINDDLDVQATAFWILVPEGPKNADYFPGDTRPFETVRNAIVFVMEELPRHQRGTAEITTDHGKTYSIDEIVDAYNDTRG